MFNFIRRYKWYRKLIRKLYEHANPYKIPVKWTLRYNGYTITIIDLSHLGDYDHIKIVEGEEFNNGRLFSYINENDRRLTVQYVINEYSHMPDKIKKRMAEILSKDLDILDDDMDKLIERTEYFFGAEDL